MGEQPNPWDLLQPQDVTSRHRGAKPLRRYELLGGISLLSPEYLLSFERRTSHTETAGSLYQFSLPSGLSASQSSALLPLHLRPVTNRPEGTFEEPSVTLLEATTPVKLPAPNAVLDSPLVLRRPKAVFQQRLHGHWRARPTPPAYPTHRQPVQRCLYKGSRVFFVPSRVIGIFTDTTFTGDHG